MALTVPHVVGIDLGTTNTLMAHADAAAPVERGERPAVHSFAIPQVVQVGKVDSQPLLPSFLYLPQAGEVPPNSLQLPWDAQRSYCVGEAARAQASLTPYRVVTSAKSWLCHPGVDRRSGLLPWRAEEGSRKVSPLEASALYLTHLREAWNYTHSTRGVEHRLEKQEIILTVPASFDAVARSLTVEAAHAAGLENVSLLEEPQAAFYAWLDAHHDDWRDLVSVGDVILICDVGGGTTDFTLIAVSENQGRMELVRLAVGDHVLLGGDNMDLALAVYLAQKLAKEDHKLDGAQMHALTHACRLAKEQLFSDPKLKSTPVAVLGRGRQVVAGTLRTELTRHELEQILLEGFFPKCAADAEPRKGAVTGLQELGLPYSPDPVVSKHLAQFLRRHEAVLKEHYTKTNRTPCALPTALLCNGGVFKAAPLTHRIKAILDGWAEAAGVAGVRILSAGDLEMAVARGAVYYGLAQRGQGIRIRGGTARAYYIGVETSQPAVPGMPTPVKAVCVAPFGMEEDTTADVPHMEVGLVVGEPVQFRFFGSSARRKDVVGTVLETWEGELLEMAPLEMTLPATGAVQGTTVPVKLHSRITPIGTLELWCVSRDGSQKWKLEFNVREQPK